jgi:hypothetical protein
MDRAIIDTVDNWAKDNAKDDYWYGSRQSYWAVALINKIITRDQYDQAEEHFGNLWTYRGD